MEKKASPPEVTILPKLYEFIVWYMDKLAKYPKKYKYTLGERIINTALDILEKFIEAQYGSKKSHHLRQANVGLEKLRYLVRLSKDLHCISLQEFEYAAKSLLEIGKMTGGWEKHSKGREGGETL